jgi:uncharacterized protein (TIRG00374 family)
MKKPNAPSRYQYLRQVHGFRKVVMLTLLASLGVFVAIALFGGIGSVYGIISRSNLAIYSLAFIAVLASYLVRFCKWSYYLRKLKIKLHPAKSLVIYLSLYSMSITPGQIGRIIGGYTLNRVTKKSFMKVAPIVTIDVFSDFLGFSIIAIATSFFFHTFFLYTVVFVLLLSISFIFLLHPSLYKVLTRIRYLRKYIKRFSSQINMYYSSSKELSTPSTYITSLLFTIPADILNSLGLYFSLLAIGIKVKVTQSLFVFAASQIFGMVSTLPGGIGVADGTIVGILGSTFNISAALSSAATIMARLATLWFGVIIGVICLLYSLKYWEKERKRRKSR